MINKRNLWFLTLFSLILVLSVYYITMPSELLISNNGEFNIEPVSSDSIPTVTVSENSILTALRIEAEEKVSSELSELQEILVNAEATPEEKNNAYEKIKNINNVRTEEEKLEKQIMDNYSLKSFVKIDGNQIRVVIESDKHDSEVANNIIRKIQENYDIDKYITVKFQV